MQQYLYKAAGVTLGITYITFLLITNALLRLALGVETDLATRQTIAWGLGLLVVTAPLWWLHWRWLRWQLAEATPVLLHEFRRYVLTISGIALLAVFTSAGAGVAVLARLALGILVDSTLGWAQSLLAVTAMLVATGIWSLHWRYVVDDAVGWVATRG